MANQQTINYIEQQIQQGNSKENITSNLLAQGLQQQDVDDAFSRVVLYIPLSKTSSSTTKRLFSNTGLKFLNNKIVLIGIILSLIILISIIIVSTKIYQGATTQKPLMSNAPSKNSLEQQTEVQTNTDSASKNTPNNTSIELQTKTQTNADSTSNEEIIKKAVQEVKDLLPPPYIIDESTTLIDVTAEPGAIRYHYILSGIDTNKITNDVIKNSIGAGICINQQTYKLLNQDITMEYSYSVENSPKQYFTSFTKSYCK